MDSIDSEQQMMFHNLISWRKDHNLVKRIFPRVQRQVLFKTELNYLENINCLINLSF